MANLDFEFYVGGIEDAILQLLEAEMKPLGVKEFAVYSGELDSENLKRSLSELAPRFPLVLVSYADGEDKQLPPVSPVFGESIHFRHDCNFTVVCATNDARGTAAQRRGALTGTKKLGVYKMLAKVREILSGLQISIVPEGETETILLTYSPLVPLANEFIARLPQITAYAVPFETYFKWSTKDRSTAGTPVSAVVLGVGSRNAPNRPDGNVPGIRKNTT